MHTISVRDVKKHAAQILAKNNMRKPEIHANGHSNGNFCSKGRLGISMYMYAYIYIHIHFRAAYMSHGQNSDYAAQ